MEEKNEQQTKEIVEAINKLTAAVDRLNATEQKNGIKLQGIHNSLMQIDANTRQIANPSEYRLHPILVA